MLNTLCRNSAMTSHPLPLFLHEGAKGEDGGEEEVVVVEEEEEEVVVVEEEEQQQEEEAAKDSKEPQPHPQPHPQPRRLEWKESIDFVEQLLAPAARPPHVLAVGWQPGDVCIWDNRTTQVCKLSASTSGFVNSRTLLGGVGAPQCVLSRLAASYLCRMLTCAHSDDSS